MAEDYFLDIDGIKGEATDSKHKDKIQLLTWSWSQSQSGSSASGGGAGSGKVHMKDFSFVMGTNKASPDLMLACATGQHFKKAELICRKAGGKQQEYLKINFTDVLISNYQIGGAKSAELPVDQVAFNYATIKFEYAAQKADGSLDTPVIRGYDIKKQIKL
jgi:type VI secretion system secreted protein Hcp